MNCQYLETVLLNTASTVLGGLILAWLFFHAREKWFALPSISGKWNFRSSTTKTSYKPFRNMELRFVAMLWCEGPRIKGTVEKVYENSSTREGPYIGEDRTRGQVEGFIEKRYFSKDNISLHIIEDGHRRESTHFQNLVIEKNGRMTGSFASTAADSEGEVIWQREEF